MAASGSSKADSQVEMNFEFHPPIQEDLQGIVTLLKQIKLPNLNLTELAEYFIKLKDVTLIIATEPSEEDDEEPDDVIYGVSSYIDLGNNILEDDKSSTDEKQSINNSIREALMKWCRHVRKFLTKEQKPEAIHKLGLIVNERFTNLPADLGLISMKALTESIEPHNFTHLVVISKIIIKQMLEPRKKKVKESQASKSKVQGIDEELEFLNPEDEILFENCCEYSDCDVSEQSDDDTYIRRIMLIEYTSWPKILDLLSKELKTKD